MELIDQIKSLYTVKGAKSKSGNKINTEVVKVEIDELSELTRYLIEVKIIDGEEINTSSFYVTEPGKIARTSVINIGLYKPAFKFYKSMHNIIIGISISGIYLNKTELRTTNVYQFEDVLNSVRMHQEDPKYIDAIIEDLKSYELNVSSLNKLQLIYDRDIDKSLLNPETLLLIKKFIGTEDKYLITPFDISFLDIKTGLVKFIMENYRSIKDDIYSNLSFRKRVYQSSIQKYINKYFSVNKSTFKLLQFESNSNPISKLSQSNKFYLLDDKKNRMAFISPFFTGILDQLRSTEGKQINEYNELSLATEVKDNTITSLVYDLDFNEVRIDLPTYVNAEILTFSNIDYRNRKIVKSEDGTYTYIKRGRYIKTTDLSNVKYLRHQSSLLSPGSCLTPMVNQTDSIRTMLSAKFMGQAVPVLGATKDLIYTSYSSKIKELDNSDVKSPCSGEVIEVTESLIRIKTDKEIKEVKSSDYHSNHHSSNIYNPQVHVGDKVEINDSLFVLNSYKDDELAINVPLLTTYSTYFNREVEDGYVISETAAKLLGHPAFKVYKIMLNFKEGINKLPNISDFPRIGDLKSDIIFRYKRKIINEYNIFLSQDQLNYEDVTVTTPMYSYDNRITEITVKINPLLNKESEEFKIISSYSNSDSRITVDRFDSLDSAYSVVMYVKIKYINPIKLSDKLSNRSSNKGVITAIVPDNEMLKTEDGRTIHVVMPALAILSRKNLFSINENKLTNLLTKIYNKLIKNETDDNIIQVLTKLYGTEFNKDDIKGFLDKYSILAYDTMTLRLMIDPFDKGFTTEEIDDLFRLIGDEDLGKETLIESKSGRRIRNKLPVGFNMYNRLHFFAESKITYTPKVNLFTELRSDIKFKSDGQKLGEQEISSILASGGEDYLLDRLSDKIESKTNKLQSEFLKFMIRIN